MKKIYLSLLIVTALAACAPVVSNHGNLVENYQLETLQPGVSTKTDVLHALGSPTTQDSFDENKWFYIGEIKSKTGVFDPKITRQRILQVTFDKEGVVDSIRDVGGHGENDIPYARDKTPTSGNDLTVMQQLIGNIGRFNGSGLQKPSGPGN